MKTNLSAVWALLILGFTLGLTTWLAPPLLAQDPPPDQQPAKTSPHPFSPDPFSMDLDSLSNTKVTTASKFSEKLSDAPSVISVVSQDEIARFGGITLAEILNRVSGLNLSSGFFQDRSTVAIGGDQSRVDSGHVLFLINGRPIREVLEGGVSSDLLESFPVGVIEKIEVIKGPGSVLYGSNAYSGVINLITKKAIDKSFRIRAAGGADGAATTSAEALYARGDLNVVGAGQYHQMPVWNTPFGFLPGLSNPRSILNISVPNNGEGAYLGVNFKGFSFMSSYTGQDGIGFVRGVVGDVRWKRGFTDLGYTLKPTAKWDMAFNLTYARNIFLAPSYPSIHRDSFEALLEWSNSIALSEKDQLTFGTLVDHISGTETIISTTPPLVDAKGRRNSTGVYGQIEHKLTDYLKLVGGVQVNKIGAISANAVPRAGIVWTPTSEFTLKALYGGAYRAPSLDETLINHPGLRGNPNLVPETVGTLNLQATYQTNRFLTSIDYFHSRQENLIVEDASTYPTHYANLSAPARFQGVNWESKYYFHKNWLALASALYQTNHDAAVAVLSPIPALSAKAGISYQGPGGATVSIFDSYQGHTPGYSAALNPLPDAIHSVSLHLRYDLSKRWFKNDTRGFAPFIYADNLTNTPVWLPNWGSGTLNTLPFNHGRTVFFGIEFWHKAE
jgi:outer membrane receptor protein involved in Fe transport